MTATVNPHGLKTLVKGAAASIRETMEKLREPGLRKMFRGGKKNSGRGGSGCGYDECIG
jgi:hypothetical protein